MSEVPNQSNVDEYQCPQCDCIMKVFRHKANPHIQYVNSGPFKGNMMCGCGHYHNMKVKLNDGSFA